MPYSLYRGLTEQSALLLRASHFGLQLESGQPLAEPLQSPLLFHIDLTSAGRDMSSVFVIPAFIVLKSVHDVFRQLGIDNVDAYDVQIRNEQTGEEFTDYVFLNIVGLIACADMDKSDVTEIGPGVNIIDELAITKSKMPDTHIFRLAEDRLNIIVSDDVQRALTLAGFTDIHFEPVLMV